MLYVLAFPNSFLPLGHKREPQTRVGLVTSSLPRKRSTTELLRLAAFRYSLAGMPLLFKRVGAGLFPALLSGRRGSNPPPIAWKAIALPNELLPLVEVWLLLWGRVDSNHRTLPRTDLQSVAIAAMRLPLSTSVNIVGTLKVEPMKGLEPPTG